MKLKILTILLALIVSAPVFPQQLSSGFHLLPEGLNIMPYKANNREAKIGVLYHTATTNLKVDIGNTIDLLGYKFNSGSKITAGIEFMAYALSTSYKGNRLQIDAVDGFFGGNVSFTEKYDDERFFLRLRIIHNSAHFVDGHYDMSTKQWIEGREPIPYTEDFGELSGGQELNSEVYSFRYFGGFSYSTLIRPSDLKRYNFHVGFEFALTDLMGSIMEHPANLFVATHINTDGANKYIVSQHSIAGVKIGEWHSKGILLYLSYYTGGDIFGAYYDRRISKFGVGFAVDFP